MSIEDNVYELCGVELASPLLNAAGSVNGTDPTRILREVGELADTAIGAITVGSFTVEPVDGNAAQYGEPVYYHDRAAGLTYNSMGLPNIGKVAAINLMPQIAEQAQDVPVIFSVSPTKMERLSSVDQSKELVADVFNAGASMVELNVSCPNVVTEGGSRKPIMGYDVDTMAELIDGLDFEFGKSERLGIKLPPYLSEEQRLVAAEVAGMILDRELFSFIVTSNTIPNQVPLDENGDTILKVPNGMGGMSGPSTRPVGLEQLGMWNDLLEGRIDIVSTLGVSSGEDIAERLSIGAVAVSGVTFLWESGNYKSAVTNILDGFVQTGYATP